MSIRQAQAKPKSTEPELDLDQVAAGIYGALINQKVNACPMAIRVAWHSSGTFDEAAGTGGSNGATMRFEPEHSDAANSGLFIIHDLLVRVKAAFPQLSLADLWTYSGCKAVEFMGGPRVPFRAGRADVPLEEADVPPNGLLPDASQGAEHLREVFGRMGFDDRDIVALSGAHTVGRCHKVRSGYDGPWTRKPLTFDNEYFRNLLQLEWKEREWDGNKQYTDVATETLCMLPTDMALRTDPAFRKIAEEYAADQAAWFRDFSSAFSRLVSQGCPAGCKPDVAAARCPKARAAEDSFRLWAMHGSLEQMERTLADAGGPRALDVNAPEDVTGRTALHKAAFWGHTHVVSQLTHDWFASVSQPDFAGDTPLHDAARFGHVAIVRILLSVGANCGAMNKDGSTPLALAQEHGKAEVATMLQQHTAGELAKVASARRESFLRAGAPAQVGQRA